MSGIKTLFWDKLKYFDYWLLRGEVGKYGVKELYGAVAWGRESQFSSRCGKLKRFIEHQNGAIK